MKHTKGIIFISTMLLSLFLFGCGTAANESAEDALLTAEETASPVDEAEEEVVQEEPAEPTQEPTPEPEIALYAPASDRLENLVLSNEELDVYTYEAQETAKEYDYTFSVTVEMEDAAYGGNVSEQTWVEDASEGICILMTGSGDDVTVTISVPAGGLYDLTFRLMTTDGQKDNYLYVNGEQVGYISCTDDYRYLHEHTVCNVYLQEGKNEITVSPYWGWTYWDTLRVDAIAESKTENKEIYTAQLTDTYATLRTKMLYQFLCDVDGLYMLSGQYADSGMSDAVMTALYEETGRYPAILGLDFMDYSPSRIAHGTTCYAVKKAIEYYTEYGGIVTISWHWNAPSQYINADADWWSGFYTSYVTMDLEAILSGEDEEGYEALLSDIDYIATKLQELEDADVPVLWRPLHEGSGGWFWWGSAGAEAYKELWILMYERLVDYHGLHNLIWLWNGQDADWYPGDDYVDIIGEDCYMDSYSYVSNATQYMESAAYTDKVMPIVMSENGTLPDIDDCLRDNCLWTYFCTWSGDFANIGTSLSEIYTELSQWIKTYNHTNVITLDELPDLTCYGLE